MFRVSLLCCLCLFVPLTQAVAETVYVTDKLTLALRERPNGGGKKLKTLRSGDSLTVLERTKNYAKVRTEGGLVGWAKVAFLVVEVPPRYRVSQLETENTSLVKKLEQAEKARDLAQQKASDLQVTLTSSEQAYTQNKRTVEELRNENDTMHAELESYQASIPLSWVAPITAGVLVFGFLAGLWWLDYRIRKRHGGFRVY